MRTVSGWGRWAVGLVSPRSRRSGSPAGFTGTGTGTAAVAAGRPLLTDRLGRQQHAGAVLDQVDGTTCGSAVLVALAAWADPAEVERLEARAAGARSLTGGGFGAAYDARQKQVHRETNRFWPQALGTTPWAAVRWLHDHVPAAGRHRVRLVDDTSPADVDALIAAVGAALDAGRPVPLLVGSFVPRHYVMALGHERAGHERAGHERAGRGVEGADGDTWRVYEPTSGQVRPVDLAAVRARRLAPLLGFDRLHAALLPH